MIRRKIAALGAAGAIALAAIGCGSADSPATPAGTQQQQQPPGGGVPPDMSGLASQLGVSASELQAAMEKLRDAGGSPDDMAATLAKELGLTTAKVQEALESARPEGAPPAAGQPPAADTTSA